MENKSHENILREAAREYELKKGALLREELVAMEQQNTTYQTPRSDALVSGLLRKDRRRNLRRLIAAAAVVAIILVSIPVTRQLQKANPPATAIPVAVIPLSFSLPPNLSVADSKEDNGQSIYYLSEEHGDDVVLTMEKDATINTERMELIAINGKAVYFSEESTYSLIAFEKDDITYTLSCQYDSNTIMQLGKNIL